MPEQSEIHIDPCCPEHGEGRDQYINPADRSLGLEPRPGFLGFACNCAECRNDRLDAARGRDFYTPNITISAGDWTWTNMTTTSTA
jgi:hypothetical protein